MSLLSLLTNHRHYWGVPHERPADQRLVQTCYECSEERLIRVELRPSHSSRGVARAEPRRLEQQSVKAA